MRKGIEKLVKRYSKPYYNLSQDYIDFLAASQYTLKETQDIAEAMREAKEAGVTFDTFLEYHQKFFVLYKEFPSLYRHILLFRFRDNLQEMDDFIKEYIETYIRAFQRKLRETTGERYIDLHKICALIFISLDLEIDKESIKKLLQAEIDNIYTEKSSDYACNYNFNYLSYQYNYLMNNCSYYAKEPDEEGLAHLELMQILLDDYKKNNEDSLIWHIIHHRSDIAYIYIDNTAESTLIRKWFEENNLKKRVLSNLRAPKSQSPHEARRLTEECIRENYLIKNPFWPSLARMINKYSQNLERYDDTTALKLGKFDKNIKKMAKLLNGIEATLKLPYYMAIFNIHDNGWVNISITNGSHVWITDKEDIKETYVKNNTYLYTNSSKICNVRMFITPDGRLFIKKKGRNIPLSMKEVCWYNTNPFFRELMEGYQESGVNYLFNDIYRDFKNIDRTLVPMPFNETYKYYNKSQLLKNKYKKAAEFRIDYNKMNINLAYMIIKSADYIDKCSYGILQNIRNEKLLKSPQFKTISGRNIKSAVIQFLTNYFMNKGYQDDITVSDYIQMKINAKQKIKLEHSEKRMAKEHNRLSEGNFETILNRIPKYKAPSKSKFNNFDKELPKGFERIRSRRRLAQESLMMQHCVWSYSDNIIKDISAIYSYMDEKGEFDAYPKRYTIEIRETNGKLKIWQIQSRCDRGCSDDFRAYMDDIVNKYNQTA